MQNFSSTVVGDLTAFTGGVTNKTNPVPKPATQHRWGQARRGRRKLRLRVCLCRLRLCLRRGRTLGYKRTLKSIGGR